MPDIAMATSSMNQLHMHEDFELDIGDGNSHHGTLYIWITRLNIHPCTY